MSWSASTPEPISKSQLNGDALTPPSFSDVDGVAGPQAEQASAAYMAAVTLMRAVGRDTDKISVSVSGHANPDHAPREGWSNEMITVSVYVVTPPPEPEEQD